MILGPNEWRIFPSMSPIKFNTLSSYDLIPSHLLPLLPPNSIASLVPMATSTNLLSKPSLSGLPKLITPVSTPTCSFVVPKYRRQVAQRLFLVPKAAAAAAGSTSETTKKPAAKRDERVVKIHSTEEFDDALKAAKNKLVVVEYAERDSEDSSKIYPFMVDLSRTCNDVEFLLVMGDESDKTKELCAREKIDKVPHFSFYKGMEKIHEEEAIGPDQLVGDVLYYGDSHSAVVQIHSGDEVKTLIADHKEDHKLIVLDVGLKHCGPCVKVYPTVIKLSRQMADTVVFARMNGDDNDSCMKFLRDMDVVEVPTFLFIRDGKICGRYVGSGKGELIGEILRYQGVRVTY